MCSKREDPSVEGHQAERPTDMLLVESEHDKGASADQYLIGNIDQETGIEKSASRFLEDSQNDYSQAERENQENEFADMFPIARPSIECMDGQKKRCEDTPAIDCDIQDLDDAEQEMQTMTWDMKHERDVRHRSAKSVQGTPSLMFLARPIALLPQYSSSVLDLSSSAPGTQGETSKCESLPNTLSVGKPSSNPEYSLSGKLLSVDDAVAGSTSKERIPSEKHTLDILNLKKGSFGNVVKCVPWARLKAARGVKTADWEGAKASWSENPPRKYGMKWIPNAVGVKENSGDEAVKEEPIQPIDKHNTIYDRKM